MQPNTKKLPPIPVIGSLKHRRSVLQAQALLVLGMSVAHGVVKRPITARANSNSLLLTMVSAGLKNGSTPYLK